MDPLHHTFQLFKLQSSDSKGAMDYESNKIALRVGSHLECVVRTGCVKFLCVFNGDCSVSDWKV